MEHSLFLLSPSSPHTIIEECSMSSANMGRNQDSGSSWEESQERSHRRSNNWNKIWRNSRKSSNTQDFKERKTEGVHVWRQIRVRGFFAGCKNFPCLVFRQQRVILVCQNRKVWIFVYRELLLNCFNLESEKIRDWTKGTRGIWR